MGRFPAVAARGTSIPNTIKCHLHSGWQAFLCCTMPPLHFLSSPWWEKWERNGLMADLRLPPKKTRGSVTVPNKSRVTLVLTFPGFISLWWCYVFCCWEGLCLILKKIPYSQFLSIPCDWNFQPSNWVDIMFEVAQLLAPMYLHVSLGDNWAGDLLTQPLCVSFHASDKRSCWYLSKQSWARGATQVKEKSFLLSLLA